jgi:hypothetical protein
VYASPLIPISVPTGLPDVVPVQLTLYGAVPPVAVIIASPLFAPLQVIFEVETAIDGGMNIEILVLKVAEQAGPCGGVKTQV